MASEGPNYAGAGADNAGVGSVAWSSPGNITADDGTAATAVLNRNTSHYLVSSSHGFAVPAGATIDGIVVEVNRWASAAAVIDDARVRIVKGGSVGATDKSSGSSWATSTATVATYGSSSDLWGETWAASDVNASNFGAALAASTGSSTDRTASVDYVRITVYYTPAGGGPTFQRRGRRVGNLLRM